MPRKLYSEMTAEDWAQIGHRHGETDLKHSTREIHNYVCRECGEVVGKLYNSILTPTVEWKGDD